MNYRKIVLKTLKKRYPDNYKLIFNYIESYFEYMGKDIKFAKISSNPMDKRLEFIGYILSIIKVLEQQGKGYEEIKYVILEVANIYVLPKNKIQIFLKNKQGKLIDTKMANILFNVLDKKISVKGNEDGFLARIITDKELTYNLGYGIDILECGVCKLFSKYNADEYVEILCEIDKITSSLAGLNLIRTKLISKGDNICEFRFKKK